MEKNLELYGKNQLINQIFYDAKVAVIKNRKLVIGMFLAVNIICLIVANVVTRNSRVIKSVVQLDYDGANEGINFDGTKFDKDRLISSSVLESLYKDSGLENDFEDNIDNLKQSISVEGLIPSDIQSISNAKLKAGERYLYTPLQYTISLKYGDEKKGKSFLEKLILQSNEKYKNKYLPNKGIGKIDFNERQEKEYDYYDHIDIFNAKLNQIQSRINFLKEKNYQSKTSRNSYSDLQTELNKLKNVEVSNYYAEVRVKKISKNAFITKMNYENKIRLAELEKMKLKDKAAAISEVIKTYKPTEKQVIVTGVTENIKLNNLDDYYSKLVNSYKDTVIAITEVDSKIREYQSNMNELRAPSLEEAKQIKQNEVIIVESINKLVGNTEGMLNSYYEERYNKFIDIIVPVYSESSGKGKIIVFLGVILGLLITISVAYIKEFKENIFKLNKTKVLYK